MRPKWTRRDQRRHLRRIASKGGAARVAKLKAAVAPPTPYGGSFLDFLDAVGRTGPSRAAWRTFWKAADGLALDPGEVETFKLHTGRSTRPTKPAREITVIAGRRSGKSENIVTRATWRAISRDWSGFLSAGESAVLPVVAPDREQGRNTLSYLKGLARHPLVAPHVLRVLKESVEFRSGAVVKVVTASWKAVRGFTFIDVVLEEAAFLQVEGSANPDEEIAAAIRPALITVPGARLYVISTPYSRKGLLFKAWARSWAKDGDALVWVASTEAMHPGVDAAEINRAFEDDPAVAMAEFGRDGLVAFRSDVESLLPREAVEAVVIPGRRELPRAAGVEHRAFIDPSGGSQDSMTLAIAHRERGGMVVLDCVREVRPPFSPESVVGEFAQVLKSYGVTRATSDRYAGAWPVERFATHGITVEPSERSKSEIYVELLPLVNAKRCELLDHPKLAAQLCGLERRTGRGTGRDSIDHGPGQHDDLCNAVAGVLVLAGGGRRSTPRLVSHPGGFRYSWTDDDPPGWQPPPELDEHGNP